VYLRKLRVRNIKLLRDVELDFTRHGQPRLWTVLIGENGLCKTALLQAIALAASGPDRANQLADVPSLRDVRHPDEPAEIEAEFGFGEQGHAGREYPGLPSRPATPPRLVSRLWIEPGWKVFQGESRYLDSPDADAKKDPLREARARGLSGWFVAGYGTVRTLLQSVTGSRSTDLVTGRLDTLFEQGMLVGANFRHLLPKKSAVLYMRSVLKAFSPGALLPNPHHVNLEIRLSNSFDVSKYRKFSGLDDFVDPRSLGFSIWHDFKGDEHGRRIVPVSSHNSSQGYQAMLGWVTDVLGHRLLENPGIGDVVGTVDYDDLLVTDDELPGEIVSAIDSHDFEGVVLVDELDLHLHPSWQVKLISALKKVFPCIQFVATTHSPMLLPELERDEVLRLRQRDNGDVCVESPDVSPALMTGSEIYETFFGIDRLYPNELGEALQRYGYLAGNPARSDEEDAELALLREKLHQHDLDPGWEPVPREGAA
jgi:AAA domain, putative AbiEii toxin, Type IV TA system